MAVGIFALGQTDVLADTLTLTVEKNTIGQGMILEPTQVEFSKGETCADVLLRGLSENGITPLYDTNSSYGFYLRGIANCDIHRNVSREFWRKHLHGQENPIS